MCLSSAAQTPDCGFSVLPLSSASASRPFADPNRGSAVSSGAGAIAEPVLSVKLRRSEGSCGGGSPVLLLLLLLLADDRLWHTLQRAQAYRYSPRSISNPGQVQCVWQVHMHIALPPGNAI